MTTNFLLDSTLVCPYSCAQIRIFLPYVLASTMRETQRLTKVFWFRGLLRRNDHAEATYLLVRMLSGARCLCHRRSRQAVGPGHTDGSRIDPGRDRSHPIRPGIALLCGDHRTARLC